MSNEENFYEAGPAHLTTIDWTKTCDRRSIAASLVKSVYVLERDRDKNRRGSSALAPPWWTAFGFELQTPPLIDDAHHSSIFGGAIYHSSSPASGAPRCVVAFRGTTTDILGDSFMRDLKLDLRVIRNRLHPTSCYKTAIEAVRGAVRQFGADSVWIAGHSLGAAIALVAAKDMAMDGVFLANTFLFNPPFPSLPVDRMFTSKRKKFTYRVATTVVKAGAALALHVEDHGTFCALASWRPHLFVNSHDLICSGYIEYFERRQEMQEAGAGEMDKVAGQHSFTGLLLHAMGKEWREPMHLIPSAYLINNRDREDGHGIQQWWNPHLCVETQTYTYSDTDKCSPSCRAGH